jgi:hypothetical protein
MLIQPEKIPVTEHTLFLMILKKTAAEALSYENKFLI